MPACHAGGHEFESRTHRKTEKEVNTIDECSLFLYEHNETETASMKPGKSADR